MPNQLLSVRTLQAALAAAAIESAAGQTTFPESVDSSLSLSNLHLPGVGASRNSPPAGDAISYLPNVFQSLNSPRMTWEGALPSAADRETLKSDTEQKIRENIVKVGNFRASHPQVGGELAAFDTSAWFRELQGWDEKFLTAASPNVPTYTINNLRERIADFGDACEGYDTAAGTLEALSQRLTELEQRFRKINPLRYQELSDRLMNAGEAHAAGDPKYLAGLRSAEGGVLHAAEELDGMERTERYNRRIQVASVTTVGAVGSVAAVSAWLGTAAVMAALGAAWRCCYSWEIGLRDRLDFVKALFRSPELGAQMCGEKGTRERIAAVVEIASSVISMQCKPGTMSEFYRGISAEKPRTRLELQSYAADLITRPLLTDLLWEKRPEKIEAAKEKFKVIAYPDSPPTAGEYFDRKSTPNAERYLQESSKVLRHGLQLHRGFSALTFSTRTLPDGTPPLLVRFGYDITDSSGEAAAVGRLNAKSPEQFPGPGIVINRPVREHMFGVTPPGGTRDDILKPYDERWPWARRALRDIEQMELIFARGVVVQTFLGTDRRYRIDGEPLAYVAFNSHHPGTRADGAFLVPRSAVQQIFKDSIVPFADYTGYSRRHSVPEIRNPSAFLAWCRSEGLVVNLTSGSNLVGSLSNGYPIDAKPLHEWEGTLRAAHQKNEHFVAFDRWGRVHKAFSTGRYTPDYPADLQSLLVSLAAGHSGAYRVASLYQASFNVLQLVFSNWKKGFIPRRYGGEYEDQADERWSRDPDDDGARENNPGRFSMLDEIFRWNAAVKKANLPRTEFPVVSIGSTFNWLRTPDERLCVDSWDLSASKNGTPVLGPILNGNRAARRAELEALWENAGLTALKAEEDITPYHRTSLRRVRLI